MSPVISAVDYDIPLNYNTDLRGFIILCILNWVICYDVCVMFVSIDLFVANIVFNIWGHIKILKYNLRHFPRPQMRGVRCNSVYNPPWYDEFESKEIKGLLIDSMKHYGVIKKFMDDVSDAFGLSMCVYYMFQRIVDCIALLELSQLSETIKDAVYDVPWECMENKNRKIVLIYLCNVQKPMELKAMGMLPVGVRTMASILKTTVSYFIFLRATVSR